MSGLPLVACPSCNARMSLDALLGHQGARDAVLALATLHPSASRLATTTLRYIGLFAPAKREMGFDRVAGLLTELAELMKTGRVERRGRVWAAPLENWIAAMDEMLAKRERLTLPLKSHGYLLEILAGYADRAESGAEEKREAERRYAFSTERQADGPVALGALVGGGARASPPRQKTPPPPDIREKLQRYTKGPKAP